MTAEASQTELISPYGGTLVDLQVPAEEVEALKFYASQLPSTILTERQIGELDLLATGGYSPLDRFMGQADYERVLAEGRLANGCLFPLPVTLAIGDDVQVEIGQDLALRDAKLELLAILTVEEIYQYDQRQLRFFLGGTTDPRERLVADLSGLGDRNLSGRVRLLKRQARHDFRDLRLTPKQTRRTLRDIGYETILALPGQHLIDTDQEGQIRESLNALGGTLLVQATLGGATTFAGVDDDTRLLSYRAQLRAGFGAERSLLSLLPWLPRRPDPRHAQMQAILARNFGASHLTLPRGFAFGFRWSETTQRAVLEHQTELGIGLVLPDGPLTSASKDRSVRSIRFVQAEPELEVNSDRVWREHLDSGEPLPDWLVRPEVAEILQDSYPPRYRQGVCLWFTGLSGSGKSTTAEIVATLLRETGRKVTLLDGDVVRTHLSKGLGFSREDRDTNIRRIAYVASEIVRHGGIAITAAISPYRATRAEARAMVGPDHFLEIYVNTPLEACEERDTKGMYAAARRGEIKGWTGIDDPYEPPEHPELALDTLAYTAEANAERVLDYLAERGFLRREAVAAVKSDQSSRYDC